MGRRHQPAPTRKLMQLMIRSHDITNTSSKMETLPFWCVVFSQGSGVHTRFITGIICRLMEHSIVFIDTSFLETQCTSPPGLTSSASVTTKLSLSPYHWPTSNARTSKHSSLSYIPSKDSGPLSISIIIEIYLTYRNFEQRDPSTKSGNRCFTFQLAGISPPFVGWH